MKILVSVKRYDYYDYNGRYSEPTITEFIGENAVVKAQAFYRDNLAKDFNYGDSHRVTTIYRGHNDDTITVIRNEHGHNYGHTPTQLEKLSFAWHCASEHYQQTRDKYGWFDLRTEEARQAEKDAWSKYESYYTPKLSTPDDIELPF